MTTPAELARRAGIDAQVDAIAAEALTRDHRDLVNTEQANAELFAELHRERVLYVEGVGYYVFRGGVWIHDELAVLELAKDVPRAIARDARALLAQAGEAAAREVELAAEGGPAKRGDATSPLKKAAAARFAHARASAGRRGLEAALALARPLLAVRPEQLDADPSLLNLQNGTIDTRTLELRPHDPRDLITRQAAVALEIGAECPLWCRFLEEVLPAERLRAYVRRLVGYFLTGSTREQIIVLAFGLGGNGKSVFFNVLLALLGTYAAKAPPDALMVANGTRHPCDLASLAGVRLAVGSEVEPDRQLDVQRVKELASGERLRVRHLYGSFFEFQPRWKWALAVNHRPAVTDRTRALWRRIHLIPFEVTVEHPDLELEEKLRAELPGILWWALEGCLVWQQEGLGPPPEVLAAVEEYRVAADGLAAFLAECCDTGDELEAPAGEFYAAYRAFSDARGDADKPLHGERFKVAMAELGHPSKKRPAGKVYLGVALNVAAGSAGTFPKVLRSKNGFPIGTSSDLPADPAGGGLPS